MSGGYIDSRDYDEIDAGGTYHKWLSGLDPDGKRAYLAEVNRRIQCGAYVAMSIEWILGATRVSFTLAPRDVHLARMRGEESAHE